MKKNEVYGRSVPINFNPLFRVMKLCLLFTVMLNLSVVELTKLLQKSEMRKDIVIELSYKGFG